MSDQQEEKVIMETLPEFEPLMYSLGDPAPDQYIFFRHLSQQVGLWSVYNFGFQLSHRPAMGMIEELNELQEGMVAHDVVKVMDAVGDVTVYMADYYSKRDWDMGAAWGAIALPGWVINLDDLSQVASQLSKKLAHYHLKGEQGIRGGADKNAEQMMLTCQHTLWYMRRVSSFLGKDYLDVVSDVWKVVSKRDWRKHRDTAHTVAEIRDAIVTIGLEGNPSYGYEVGDEE